MNIKKQIPKFLSVMLSFSMAFGAVIPAYATEVFIGESSLEEVELDKTELEAAELEDTVLNETDGENLIAPENKIEVQADSESRYEEIEVNYSQASSYFVTIPKSITLGTDKKAPYSIKVEGDIVANKQVCVVPVDGIADTDVFDFYMEDQIAGSTKADVVAEVSQAKFYWNHEEAASGYEENGNYVVADGLSAGKWKGTFQIEISMRTDPSHIHNYVGEVTKEPTCTESGERTYTCDCGDSYTEFIDPTGHHFAKGECTDCGEKDPDHEHNYTEMITKQPTCTEAGEKTYTCNCGDSYTEILPATGHHYVDGECEHCGEKDPDYHKHSYTETVTKQPTCTEAGEKTYTCNCGDSYTEKIPATGHHYGADDKCTDCGELNPEHKHSYSEKVTKEATCTEEGEKTYTCGCGESFTEKIPATGHNYVDGTCTICGKEKNPYDVAPANAFLDWNYTLDATNNIITLNYYIGKATDVIVYTNYPIGSNTYKTRLANYGENGTTYKQYMFSDYSYSTNNDKIETIKFSKDIDTSNITYMSYMFYNCNSLTSLDISGFNTSNVTAMRDMFYNCRSLTSLDISNFDTSNVTDMCDMFWKCEGLTSLDLSNFNTSNVTTMGLMFRECRSLTNLDISSFDTSNVTSMNQMFFNCNSLMNLDVSSFNTSKVTSMYQMFSSCKSLTEIDLSSFDVIRSTNVDYMFSLCSNLKTIYVTRNRWNAVSANMFESCGTSSVTYK